MLMRHPAASPALSGAGACQAPYGAWPAPMLAYLAARPSSHGKIAIPFDSPVPTHAPGTKPECPLISAGSGSRSTPLIPFEEQGRETWGWEPGNLDTREWKPGIKPPAKKQIAEQNPNLTNEPGMSFAINIKMPPPSLFPFAWDTILEMRFGLDQLRADHRVSNIKFRFSNCQEEEENALPHTNEVV